jgi:polyhydroxyalkanoate synthesis regulator phasin
MPKKKPGMTPEEQSERFKDTVRELVDAGELNPIEADEAFQRLLEKAAPKRPKSPE